METRVRARPLLSIFVSGAIEQDADIVCLLRPEYYKIDEWDDEEHPNSRTGR